MLSQPDTRPRSRDRTAKLTSGIELLPDPVTVAGRDCQLGCQISLQSLAPLRTGVELRPLISRLSVFPADRSWAIRLRRPLLSLPAKDARVLDKALAAVAQPPREVIGEYLAAAVPPAR